MTKSKNKKSWLEKLNEANAKQEARPKPQNKSTKATLRSKSDSQTPKPSKKILISLALVFPFLAWIIAAFSNPTGWASNDPSIVFLVFMACPALYWYISIPLLFIFLFLVTSNKMYAGVVLVFLTSLIGSIFIFMTTLNANESEFTG